MYIASLSFDGSFFQKHRVSMAVDILHSTRGMNIKTSAELWQPRAKLQGSVKAQWLKLSSTSGGSGSKTSDTSDTHIDVSNVGAGDWLVHNDEPNTDCGF